MITPREKGTVCLTRSRPGYLPLEGRCVALCIFGEEGREETLVVGLLHFKEEMARFVFKEVLVMVAVEAGVVSVGDSGQLGGAAAKDGEGIP